MASDDTVSNSAKDSAASNDTAGGSKKAIVVEGGAMRGIFASGVIDHFLEQGYHELHITVMEVQPYTNLTFGRLQLLSAHARSVVAELETIQSLHSTSILHESIPQEPLGTYSRNVLQAPLGGDQRWKSRAEQMRLMSSGS